MPPKSYRLSEKERAYLQTGTAPGSYRPHELDQRVDEKVSLLGKRVQQLIDDVALLDEVQRLEPKTWGRPWLNLLADSVGAQGIEDPFTYDADSPFGNGDEVVLGGSVLAELGRELGKLVSRLLVAPAGVDNTEIRADLAWGFLHGLGPNTIRAQPTYLREASHVIGERAGAEIEHRKALAAGFRDNLDSWQATADNVTAHITDALHEIRDEPPEAWMVHRIEKTVEEEQGDGWLFIENDAEIEELLPKSEIDRLYETLDIETDSKLLQACRRLESTLETVEWSDITAIEIVHAFDDYPPEFLAFGDEADSGEQAGEEPLTVREIALRLGDSQQSPAVAKLARYLANEASVTGHEWPGPAVVTLTEDPANLAQWTVTLTKFGEVLRNTTYPVDSPAYGFPAPRDSLEKTPDETIAGALESLSADHAPDSTEDTDGE